MPGSVDGEGELLGHLLAAVVFHPDGKGESACCGRGAGKDIVAQTNPRRKLSRHYGPPVGSRPAVGSETAVISGANGSRIEGRALVGDDEWANRIDSDGESLCRRMTGLVLDPHRESSGLDAGWCA